jgi:NAD(P)-dependent dehydrogenase (short-subunit alcohol dehydrogenase family)
MGSARYYLFTGATSGLGLEAAAQLAQTYPQSVIIVGARETASLDSLRRVISAAQLHILTLDTSSLASVRSFANEVTDLLGTSTLAGMALNAGVQIVSGDRYSVDGFELTFATNVLGHVALFRFLQPVLSASATIVSTASGTHDKDNKLAKPYKFYGGYFPSAAAVAAGDVSTSADKSQLGRDRYATSKLCNILFTYAMARKFGQDGPRFIAYDPGLMPGTELARDQPAALRFAWKNVLPTAAKLIDGASTAKRSGAMLAQLLGGRHLANGTGLHVEFTGQEIRSSEMSYDVRLQDALMAWVGATAFGETQSVIE